MSLGENLYGETAASGQPVTGFPQEQGFGRLLQGMLESSNVEIVQEMTDMIAAQRAVRDQRQGDSCGRRHDAGDQ